MNTPSKEGRRWPLNVGVHLTQTADASMAWTLALMTTKALPKTMGTIFPPADFQNKILKSMMMETVSQREPLTSPHHRISFLLSFLRAPAPSLSWWRSVSGRWCAVSRRATHSRITSCRPNPFPYCRKSKPFILSQRWSLKFWFCTHSHFSPQFPFDRNIFFCQLFIACVHQ